MSNAEFGAAVVMQFSEFVFLVFYDSLIARATGVGQVPPFVMHKSDDSNSIAATTILGLPEGWGVSTSTSGYSDKAFQEEVCVFSILKLALLMVGEILM